MLKIVFSFCSVKEKPFFSGTMNSGGSKVGGFGSHAATGGVGMPDSKKKQEKAEREGKSSEKFIKSGFGMFEKVPFQLKHLALDYVQLFFFIQFSIFLQARWVGLPQGNYLTGSTGIPSKRAVACPAFSRRSPRLCPGIKYKCIYT